MSVRGTITGHAAPGVLHLVSSLEIGGIETLLTNFAEATGRRAENSIVITILNDKIDRGLSDRLERCGLPVYFLRRPEGSKNPAYFLRLLRIFFRHRVKVIHAHDHGSKHFGMLCKALRPSLKILFSVHDRFLFDGLSSPKLYLHKRLVHCNIAISRSVLSYCAEKGIHRARVIPNGIKLDRFSKGTRTFMEDGVLRIVNVARLTHEIKGQDVLLRALALLKERGCLFRCDLIGGEYPYDPDSPVYLRELTSQLGLTEEVAFLGNRPDVADLLPGYDVFVLPSRTEGFGLVLLEALASGLMVLASRLDGPQEILGEDRLGWLFSPGNEWGLFEKLHRLYEKNYDIINPDVIRQEISRYDIEFMTNEYLDLYNELMRNGKRGAL
ncbi:glycosyltransferase [Cohnella sp. AR92]|uniref:glycosyltransferase n=1 Tax=Cohnella sp. AR92 TaxID=648716 RepID=UPI000F8E4F9E|nr:glycosyltransferase [Cohnella sp. AR92]RUS42612.1 glycosyltransferase [Cohnella sp. AR92]